ncbi:MAG TPA: 3'-5' exonuclease [Chthoniobacterales bacterium]|nr:3'-5' exonuclease [Chthoniobacterales bacterium]
MATLINPIDRRFHSATSGERRFEGCLKRLLEDDYLCWYDVPLGPKRHHPDFVVIHPKRGLLVLEVKDWWLATLCRIDKHHVDLLLGDGRSVREPNPLEQARHYANAVVDRLSADPQLQNHSGSYQGRLCFPYGYGVVLTNITRRQLDQALSQVDQDSVLPARLVICKDEMTESVDPMEFQERLWGMFHYAFGEPLTLPQLERVRWHLFPEIRIDSVQQDFLVPPMGSNGSSGSATPVPVRVMDLQQEQLARSLGNGHRVIHGVAGSGKTLILGYRCLHLAQTTHKPVLVLCFNITLAARLRAFVEQRGVADKVHVYHFHGWCKTQLRTYHVKLIDSNEEVWERQVRSVIAGVENGFIPRAQYGAVMIDEGHDFEPGWFKLVVQMIDSVNDSLLLLYDDAQSIYKKSSGLKFSLSSVGIKAPGRTTILRLNYRNTREILEFAYTFAKAFISPQSADEDHIPLIEPQSGGPSGPKPAFRKKGSIQAEVGYAVTCLRKWHDAGESLNEMAVICANGMHCRLIQRQLQRSGLAHLWLGSRESKAAYDPDKPQVSILSIQSSKGLEFKSVIFIGLGHFTEALEEKEQAKLLYVGMTRARERLILTASEETPLTERLAAMAA